jgi:hypothetical protein
LAAAREFAGRRIPRAGPKNYVTKTLLTLAGHPPVNRLSATHAAPHRAPTLFELTISSGHLPNLKLDSRLSIRQFPSCRARRDLRLCFFNFNRANVHRLGDGARDK